MSRATSTPTPPTSMSDIHASIGSELQGFGGHLECTTCGNERPLGDVGGRLRDGWPMCCGYTMRWVTQRQIDALSPPVPDIPTPTGPTSEEIKNADADKTWGPGNWIVCWSCPHDDFDNPVRHHKNAHGSVPDTPTPTGQP